MSLVIAPLNSSHLPGTTANGLSSQFGQEANRVSPRQNKEIAMSKRIAIAAVLIAIATPALAEDFYVGQDPESKRCKIVTEKPDGQTMIMIGTAAYATKEEAKAAKKAASECLKKESSN
jgi:hypothetical protein